MLKGMEKATRFPVFFEDLAASNKNLQHMHFATLASLASASRLICSALHCFVVPLGDQSQIHSTSSF